MRDSDLHYELSDALYAEAELLDARQFDQWLDMLTQDIVYWVPIRDTRHRGEEHLEFTEQGKGAGFFDDDRRRLELRVKKVNRDDSWAENPFSRTRHLVSNIRIRERHADDDVTVSCNFILYRSRLETDEDMWVGRRLDRLRREDGRWKIARREVFLDQTVLQSSNLSNFF